MIRRWMLAVAGGLLVATVAQAQVPVGNQATFGRGGAGRAYPFLNRHAYSTTFDQGRPIPNGQQHAYGTGSSLFATVSSQAAPTTNTSSNPQGSPASPTVPPPFGFPAGLIFNSGPGLIVSSPFQPFSGLNTTTPVISTVSPSTFQSSSFIR